MTDREPRVASGFDDRFVLLDDDDVLAAFLEAFGEFPSHLSASDDDDAHWYHVEFLGDLSCEAGLEDDGHEDHEKDGADELVGGGLHTDRRRPRGSGVVPVSVPEHPRRSPGVAPPRQRRWPAGSS